MGLNSDHLFVHYSEIPQKAAGALLLLLLLLLFKSRVPCWALWQPD